MQHFVMCSYQLKGIHNTTKMKLQKDADVFYWEEGSIWCVCESIKKLLLHASTPVYFTYGFKFQSKTTSSSQIYVKSLSYCGFLFSILPSFLPKSTDASSSFISRSWFN